jgi:hypothetical protein
MAGLLALVLFLAWTALPDAHPDIVLVAFICEAVCLLALYLVQRHRHW